MSGAAIPLRPQAPDPEVRRLAIKLAGVLGRAGAVADLVGALCERPQLLALGVATPALMDEIAALDLHLLAVEAELRAILAGDRR